MSYFRSHEAINAGLFGWGSSDILYKNLNLLFPNFYVFVAVISFFYIITVFFLIKNNLLKNRYWFAVLILLINPYLFLVHLSSFRQTLAICFIIFAVHFGIKKNFIIYVLFVLVAAGFHQSALIMLPIYFLLKESKINVFKVAGILGVIMLLLLTPLFSVVILWIIEYFPKHYEYYFNQGLQNTLRATLISSFFFFLILFNINKLNGKELIFGKLALIATIIQLLAFKLSLITRVGMYFDVFLIISIPQIFSKIKKGKIKILLFSLMLCIFILRYYSFFNNEIWIDSYRTYQTILNK